MTTVPLDDKTVASLVADKWLVAVTDGSGRGVGFFAPVELELAKEYAAAAAHFYPRKDLPRGKSNGKAHTTAELLEYLKSLEQR